MPKTGMDLRSDTRYGNPSESMFQGFIGDARGMIELWG